MHSSSRDRDCLHVVFLADVSFDGIHQPGELAHMTEFREMEKSLATASFLSNGLAERTGCCGDTDLVSIFETVGNRLGDTVDADGLAIDSHVEHALCQGLAGEPDKAQAQILEGWLSSFAVNRHPGGTSGWWKNAIKVQRGFKAHNTVRYALAGDHHPALVGSGKFLTCIDAPVNPNQKSVAHSSTYGFRMNSISRQVSGAQNDLFFDYPKQAIHRKLHFPWLHEGRGFGPRA